NKSVTTNDQGAFFLQNVVEEAVLQISFVGYKVNEVNVAKELGDIRMEVGNSDLEEVSINAGYYTTTEKLRTGNIAKITAKDIRNQPVTSPLMALQGRMAGVDVSANNGIPGAMPSIRIRGANSIRFDGGYPLYVIDGVVIDSKPIMSNTSGMLPAGYDPLSILNTENVESIEVLKDADATAIYGSRGANGVILITTKRAKPGKVSVNLNVYQGAGQVAGRLQMLNTSEYLNMRREAFNNNSETPTVSSAPDLVLWDQNRRTDWQEELLGGNAVVTDVQTDISAGNDNLSFRFGAAYHQEGTIYPGDFGFDKFNGQLGLNYKTTDQKFNMSVSVIYGKNKTKFFESSSYVTSALTLSPNTPELRNNDGSINWAPDGQGNYIFSPYGVNQPLAGLENKSDANLNSINISSNLSYRVFDNLLVRANIGYTNLSGDEFIKRPLSAFDPINVQYNAGSSYYGNNQRSSWIFEPQLVYTRQVNNHSIEASLGTTFQGDDTKTMNIYAYGFSSDALLNSLRSAPIVSILNDDNEEYKYTALFARIGYNYKEKYLINLTGRRDGSSRFGDADKFGNFGAIGAAWIISEENFVKKNLRFLSFAKVRGSFG
ncbi:MAG: SusC/RagA family TonB-linked outer membrane protein, partial [Pedobacter sp.]